MIITGGQEGAYPRLRDRLSRLDGLTRGNPQIVAAMLDAVVLSGAAGAPSPR